MQERWRGRGGRRQLASNSVCTWVSPGGRDVARNDNCDGGRPKHGRLLCFIAVAFVYLWNHFTVVVVVVVVVKALWVGLHARFFMTKGSSRRRRLCAVCGAAGIRRMVHGRAGDRWSSLCLNEISSKRSQFCVLGHGIVPTAGETICFPVGGDFGPFRWLRDADDHGKL